MIVDSDDVILNETENVDEIITEYCLLQEGSSPTASTTWYTIDNLPEYIDNVGGTQYVYWMRQTIKGYTEDPTPVGKTIGTSQMTNKDLTKSGKTAAMVRQYGDGVLVCRKNKTVGALVNADGSFDVVQVSWSGDIPTAGAVLASYGNKLMVMKDSDRNEYLRMEDFRTSTGVSVVERIETERPGDSTYLNTSYNISSLTSVIRVSDSTNITSNCTFNSHFIYSSLFTTVGEKFKVTYKSQDGKLKAFTFGNRTGTKGGLSMAIGDNNTASGLAALTVGGANTVSGAYSSAIGAGNNVSGDHSFAEGAGNTVTHDRSAAIGESLKSGMDNQLVIGKYNSRSNISNKYFVVGANGQNVFTVGLNGELITRNLSGVYAMLYCINEVVRLRVYDYENNVLAKMSLGEEGFFIDDVNQFFSVENGLDIAGSHPYSGYITNSTKTIRLTIPVGKSLQKVSSITVTDMTGAIIGPDGYLNIPGSSAVGSHNTVWTGNNNVTVSATKINNYTIGVSLVGTSAFYNTSNNRPLIYAPANGGISFSFT